jgi:outer membrane protein TolC
VSGVYGAQERQLLLQYNGLASDHLALVNNTLAAAESLYWQSFIARQNIFLQRGILNQRKEDLRITEEKFRQQLIPRLDVVRAQAKVEEAESLVVEAESAYRNTLAQMATLAGGTDLEPKEESLPFCPGRNRKSHGPQERRPLGRDCPRAGKGAENPCRKGNGSHGGRIGGVHAAHRQ